MESEKQYEVSLKEMSGILLGDNSRDVMLESQQEKELLEFQRKQIVITIKNNILFVRLVNCICIIGNGYILDLIRFAVSFYQWYELHHDKKILWLNMLYVYFNGYISFENQKEQENYCGQGRTNKSKSCLQAISVLEVVGAICFLMILLSLCLQLYDLWRMRNLLLFVNRNTTIKNKLKGRLLYSLIIIFQMIALLLYLATLIWLSQVDQIINFSMANFGASYWVSVSCNLISIIFACYYRWQKNRYHRFLAMESLIDTDLIDQMEELDIEN